MSILRPGFYNSGGDITPEALSLAPNKWTPTSGDPKNAVYIPDINIPTERLLLAINMIMGFMRAS